MKKVLLLMMFVLFTLGFSVFAGPFVDMNVTLPDGVVLTAGAQTGGLSIAGSIDNLMTLPWDIGFAANYKTTFEYADVKMGIDIASIDMYSSYPIPIIGDISATLDGTFHIADILESPGSSVLDLRGGIELTYDQPTSTLTPTFTFGFRWEY